MVCNLGLLSIRYVLLWSIVASVFGYWVFQVWPGIVNALSEQLVQKRLFRSSRS